MIRAWAYAGLVNLSQDAQMFMTVLSTAVPVDIPSQEICVEVWAICFAKWWK